MSRTMETRLVRLEGVASPCVLVLPPGGLPRTTSGKVQRHACREAYVDGRFASAAAPDAPVPVAAAGS